MIKEKMAKEPKTILVVDDEHFIKTLIAKALMKEGYQVLVSGDYESSIKILNSTKIDLVISDVLLPSAGGGGIMQHIRENKNLQHVPVILITGLDKDVLSGRNHGETVLTKPFDMKKLVSLVRVKLAK